MIDLYIIRLFIVFSSFLLISCSNNHSSSDSDVYQLVDWDYSGVLVNSLNLSETALSNIINTDSSNFYVEEADLEYDVKRVYLTYTVSETIPRTNSVENTTAMGLLYYPSNTDDFKGLIIYFPGTNINGDSTISSDYSLNNPNNFLLTYASHGYAIIYYYYTGTYSSDMINHVTSDERHQKLGVLSSLNTQTTALLDAFVDYAVDNNISISNKKLFLLGHSLGGLYSASYHLYYQTLSNRKFNLMTSIASAASYDIDITY